MSLPNYLARIKSSGIYRFTHDKSLVIVPPITDDAETLRLVVGYSEKGPFNAPVYIQSPNEFVRVYGNISKRLEHRGVYFHRMALQALEAGPILALNLKPFEGKEAVDRVNFAPNTWTSAAVEAEQPVKDLYDKNRFWKLDPAKLAGKNYISFAATDSDRNSCTVVMRKADPAKLARYDIDIDSWFSNYHQEMPEYLEFIKDQKLNNYFMDVFVFRGKFEDALISGNGILAKYFVESGAAAASTKANPQAKTPAVTTESGKTYLVKEDMLDQLARDPNSNFVRSYTGCVLPNFKDGNNNYIALDILFNADYMDHKMMMYMDESLLEDKCDADEKTAKSAITTLLNIQAVPENKQLTPLYVKGYNYTFIGKEKGAELTTKIFSMLKTEEGIIDALTNHVDSEYHYIVDTFDAYKHDASKVSNAVLANIAMKKGNTFAFLNFPKMSLYGENGIKNVKADADLWLPVDAEGASFCGYFTQLKFSDGTVKTTVPSAALVSNNFMEKYRSRQPYYIVAGPNHGVLSYNNLIGPDYNFSREDLDVLEPLGINAIIYVPRKGTYINSNQTAKQKPITALSKIHIRELVIFLQDEIESLLQSYQWELNTQPLRDTIKAKADAILETVKNNGGVYAYLNTCDETNNTPEVIDNEMLILNTEIEPARGAGKMVHELTIYKTGELTSRII